MRLQVAAQGFRQQRVDVRHTAILYQFLALARKLVGQFSLNRN